MKCVLCYMVSIGAESLEIPFDCKDAITIINGYATCEGHFAHFQLIHHTSLSSLFQTAWDKFQYDAGLSKDKYANVRHNERNT